LRSDISGLVEHLRSIGVANELDFVMLITDEETRFRFVQLGAFDGSPDDRYIIYGRRMAGACVLVVPRARILDLCKAKYSDIHT
jgi:hypothetical protein